MFPGESFAGCLGRALVFVWGGEGREGFKLCFSAFFATIEGAFIFWGEGLGTGLRLYEVLRFFWFFLIS